MTKKIFIYADKHTADLSLPDIKTLFSTTDIFSSRADLYFFGNNTFNTDGLVDPLLVIPGGLTFGMAKGVMAQMQMIRSNLGEKFDYLGICAGGMLATGSTDLFYTPHKWHAYKITQYPQYISPLADCTDIPNGQPSNLNLFPDYQALGAFYPNFSRFMVNTEKSFVPYRVTLDLAGSNRKLNQLFISGPSFIQTDAQVEDKSEIIATYEGRSHVFDYSRNGQKFFDRPPAILAQRATDTHGARMIAGTHIETCVKNSNLLAACEKDNKYSVALPSEDYEKLVAHQEETQAEVVALLRRTFNR